MFCGASNTGNDDDSITIEDEEFSVYSIRDMGLGAGDFLKYCICKKCHARGPAIACWGDGKDGTWYKANKAAIDAWNKAREGDASS